eukprot:Lankesteria_metandrocarpae@DN5111_c0_g1_i1.p2
MTSGDVASVTVSLKDTFLVIGFAFFAALLSEVIGWCFTYRHDDYQQLVASIQKHARKIERQKIVYGDFKSTKSVKLEREEAAVKERSQQLQSKRTKSGLASTVLLFVLLPMLNQRLEGVTVAKLPFTPMFPVRSLSHRSLPGTDLGDCAVTLLYFLAIGFFRNCLPRVLGTAPTGLPQQGPSLFGMAPNDAKKRS